MISERKIVKIYELRKAGASVNAIARKLDLSWSTVKSYLEDVSKADGGVKHRNKHSKTEAFADDVKRYLRQNENLGKQRLTSKRLYEIMTDDHDLGVSLRTFQRLTKSVDIDHQEVASVPQKHRAGCAQIDFGCAKYYEKGKKYEGKYLVLTFPHSGVSFAILLPSENQQCLFFALIEIFKALDGVPKRIRFDNASSMVNRGKTYTLNDRFRFFAAYYGFKCERCNPARGNEKGSVERAVSTIRQNFLSPPPRFGDLHTFNKKLLHDCRRLITGKRYGTSRMKTELFDEDLAELLPLPEHHFEISKTEYRVTNKCALITFDGHRYSTRSDLAQKEVIIQYSAFSVNIMDVHGNFVAKHCRCYNDEDSIDMMSYIDSFVQNPRALYGSGFMTEEFAQKVANTPKGKRKQMILDELFHENDVISMKKEKQRHEKFKDLFNQ